ncbi:MAG: hypothetical protein COA97_00240 [Flavobacteriales bacterium]|nr:MAG: hypothetical protein COA97_00240 [Flavobacteriales bacterium]
MKKSTILDKKILKYMSASAAVLATGASATGQIIYTDVIPDAVVAGQGLSVNIDVNNDLTDDFIAAVVGNTTVNAAVAVPFATGTACAGGNVQNEIMGTMPSNYDYVSRLSLNDPISATGPWMGTNCVQGTMGYYVIANGSSPYSENWNNGVTDGYMGLKFESGGNIYYGWARFDVSADQLTLTLKDYAYESTPNTMIPAGAMPVGISENITSQITFFNSNNIITLKADNELTNGVMKIISTTGQIVKEIKLVSGNQQIDLSELAGGLYVANITFNEGVMTRKITIK